jgi:hypothetical protein
MRASRWAQVRASAGAAGKNIPKISAMTVITDKRRLLKLSPKALIGIS